MWINQINLWKVLKTLPDITETSVNVITILEYFHHGNIVLGFFQMKFPKTSLKGEGGITEIIHSLRGTKIMYRNCYNLHMWKPKPGKLQAFSKIACLGENMWFSNLLFSESII